MNVTSMLSNGYLRPAVRPESPRNAVLTEKIERTPQTTPLQVQALARQERQVLAEERGLRLSAGPAAEVSTVYHYTLGPDGRRYISGASVTLKGDREDLERVPGGTLSPGAAKAEAQSDEAPKRTNAPDELQEGKSPEKDAVIRELENIERGVIAHEAAHQAAAGRFGGPVSYTRTMGPDGKSYITGGQVPIRFVTGSTPEETLRNMEQIQKAALAPGDPSGQDIRVAARAASAAAEARHEIARKREGEEGQEVPARTLQPQREDPSRTGAASILAALRFQGLVASA